MRLRPQVASRLSRGRRYRWRIMKCSTNKPSAAAMMKEKTSDTRK
jgi:hypothetical protein